MKVLVTGSKGFIGRNLVAALKLNKELTIFEYDLENDVSYLEEGLKQSEIIFHLAGVNRPETEEEFHTGNTGSIKEICRQLKSIGRSPKIVLSSSIQAELDNPYGVSKRNAEEILEKFSVESGGECVVYRFKNLFGKWCRPNYNSVTATFCYNIAHDLPIQISDPTREIDLTYIDDVVNAFVSEIRAYKSGFRFASELPSYRVALGKLSELIYSFKDVRTSLNLPDFSQPFIRALYAAYLSYLDGPNFIYGLDIKTDERGSLAEFIKSSGFGQIFISHTKPGVTRGNHYHHTKTEKFMVVQGEAVIRFRHIEGGEIIEHHVKGENYKVVDIPPGYTHSIENIGNGDLVTLFWASEMFDHNNPDTFWLPVKD